jgi:hypothetical protein
MPIWGLIRILAEPESTRPKTGMDMPVLGLVNTVEIRGEESTP